MGNIIEKKIHLFIRKWNSNANQRNISRLHELGPIARDLCMDEQTQTKYLRKKNKKTLLRCEFSFNKLTTVTIVINNLSSIAFVTQKRK